MNYLATFAIGFIFGLAELLSRYKENPKEVFFVFSSYVYLVLNGFASILVYWFFEEYNITLGGIGSKDPGRIIISGLSSMFVLRSSLLNFKLGEKTVDVGLAAVMTIFLSTADRSFDRRRSESSLSRIKDIMKDVDFKKAEKNLPMLCLASMRNLSREEQEKLGREVGELSKNDLDGLTKSLALGIILSKLTGPSLLQAAVSSIREKISYDKLQQGEIAAEDRDESLKKKFAEFVSRLHNSGS